jgi:hydroxymethylpyrimidine pyrophosphatase-like HAD family hydrolase
LSGRTALAIIADILAHPCCEVLISGAETSYLIPKSEAFVTLIRDYVGNPTQVLGSAEEVPEEIIKLSAFCEDGDGIAPHAPDLLARWGHEVQTVISGFGWLDFTVSDKGSGLRQLQELLGLERGELMAFGDNDNDVTMLRAAGHSYAMATASERALCAATAQSDRVEPVLAALYR